MMTTKEKILKYLEFKGISQEKFNRVCGFSSGFLRIGKHIGSEKVKIIRNNYTDLNIKWLLFDEGEMIKSPYLSSNFANDQGVSEKQETYVIHCQNCENLEKRVALMEQLLKSKEELLDVLKSQLAKEATTKSKAS